ncbi:FxLYD domain-containing protein [Paenibacillus sp. 2TAB19]|uniref:FxLYD domain-containing protein n=1 Tax=Paenibacillus sp. 2TAB19 TaxID=3233003 RepID=UPI003F998564
MEKRNRERTYCWELKEVHCHQCGKLQPEDAVYCNKCGKQLLIEADEQSLVTAIDAVIDTIENESAVSAELSHSYIQAQQDVVVIRQRNGGSWWMWLTPVALAVLAAAAVTVYYGHESRLNDKVILLQQQAREDALAGKYEEALASLDEAAGFRPDFAPVQADKDIIKRAAGYEELLESAKGHLAGGKLIEAERLLIQVKEDLKDTVEPIFTQAKKSLDSLSGELALHKLTQELDTSTTINELAAKLNIASGLDGDEAIAVREQIKAKIVDIGYEEADSLLNKKKYNDAMDAVDKALLYVSDDERLLGLKSKISNEKDKYEQAEQQRLEQAMQKAAEEDLKNQTAAVEVVRIEGTLDEFGDLIIHGELKNAATRPIYTVVVEYTVYDAQHNKIGTGTAEATPDYIEPGEAMSFSGTVYGVYVENTTVVVDHATWYLD